MVLCHLNNAEETLGILICQLTWGKIYCQCWKITLESLIIVGQTHDAPILLGSQSGMISCM